ncbi:MAG: cupin domain-containing protein [Bryobacteraceae bacterium]
MFTLKSILLSAFCSAFLLNAQNAVDVLSSADLKQLAAKLAAESKKKGGAFAGQTLAHYGNNLTMIAHRETTGSSELHTKDADVFFVVEGDSSLVTGGRMVKPQNTQPNEVRGTGIEGGTTRKLGQGDVVQIQPNTPHQMLIAPGHSITYFVVKVTE